MIAEKYVLPLSRGGLMMPSTRGAPVDAIIESILKKQVTCIKHMQKIRPEDILEKFRCNNPVLWCPCNNDPAAQHRIVHVHPYKIVFECCSPDANHHHMRFDEMELKFSKKLEKCLRKICGFESEQFREQFARLNLKYIPPQQQGSSPLDFGGGIVEYTGEAWNLTPDNKAGQVLGELKAEFRVDDDIPVSVPPGADALSAIAECARKRYGDDKIYCSITAVSHVSQPESKPQPQPVLLYGDLYRCLGLKQVDVSTDGNCWIYAMFAALLGSALIQHLGFPGKVHEHAGDLHIAEAIRLFLWRTLTHSSPSLSTTRELVHSLGIYATDIQFLTSGGKDDIRKSAKYNGSEYVRSGSYGQADLFKVFVKLFRFTLVTYSGSLCSSVLLYNHSSGQVEHRLMGMPDIKKMTDEEHSKGHVVIHILHHKADGTSGTGNHFSPLIYSDNAKYANEHKQIAGRWWEELKARYYYPGCYESDCPSLVSHGVGAVVAPVGYLGYYEGDKYHEGDKAKTADGDGEIRQEKKRAKKKKKRKSKVEKEERRKKRKVK